MTRYFADTWYFIAWLDRTDAHHARARRLDALYGRGKKLVTHDAVLTELLAYFSGFGAQPRAKAVEAVRQIVHRMEVVPGSRTLFIAGLDLYARRPDKEYSLVDCMSMALMRDRGITHVLTNDHHFSQEGFTVLSDAS
jgi:predicted nucleic acid-binding protein